MPAGEGADAYFPFNGATLGKSGSDKLESATPPTGTNSSEPAVKEAGAESSCLYLVAIQNVSVYTVDYQQYPTARHQQR
jgi:hypothetical protein